MCWHSLQSYCTVPYPTQQVSSSRDVFVSKAHSHRGARDEGFHSDAVQTILKRLTGCDMDKIFKKRLVEKLDTPKYTVATEEELVAQEEKSVAAAQERLEMPTLRGMREPIDIILDEDHGLIDFDEHGADFVFTDISDSVDDYNRAIIVRENRTGILREADWDLREKINNLYWSPMGFEKLIEKPPLLEEENLNFILKHDRHEEILDFIYTHFEEDSEDAITLLHKVYDNLGLTNNFELLLSTRYYGGLMYYFVSSGRTSELIEYFDEKERTDDAEDIEKLHMLVHGEKFVRNTKKLQSK